MDEYEKFLDYAKSLKVRAVYKKMYPTCIYDITRVGDSIIRERIFAILSELYGVTYDEIYNLWR